ncbi:hypothetical protein AB0K57_32295 [Streptomyces halstedii]|uniref:hypothetical protein n=1 Tax=Streptomyces halstedii TaxID=1944 RepID=UPI003460195B
MYELSRVRLKSVGPAGARFHDVLLDLSGAGRTVEYQQPSLWREDEPPLRPSPASLVLLENGGGKSVLLKLIFSVLLPGRRQILGTSNTRILNNFVLAKDVSHIVLEWMDVRTGNLLLTGKVMSWRNQVASASADSLVERWYCMRPGPTLGLDTLPLAIDGQSLLLQSYKDELEDAHAKDESLQVDFFKHQGDWTERLQHLGIDSELFRYQRDMNVDEGEAVGALQLDSDGKFVDFLLKIVFKADDLEELAALVAAHVERLANRGMLLSERDFVDGTLARLGPVSEQARAMQTSQHRQHEAEAAYRHAATKIRARAESEHTALKEQQAAVEKSAEQARAAERAVNRLTAVEAALTCRLAQMTLTRATERLERRNLELAQAKALVEAWTHAPTVLEYDENIARVASLRDLVEAEEEKAQPALQAHDQAARRLARALWAGADTAAHNEREQRELAAHCTENEKQARKAASAATGKAAAARAENTRLTGLITEVHAKIDAAVTDGLLADTHALTRTLADIRENLTTVSRRITSLEQERSTLAVQEHTENAHLSQAQEEADTLRQHKDEAQRDLDAATTLTTAIEGEPRLTALLETQRIDLERDAGPLLARLAEALSDAHREQTDLQVDEAADQQARLALAAGGLLPPPPAVAEACTILKNAGITAFSGGRYIEGIPDPQRRHELVQRMPHLAAGILLNDPGDMEKAKPLLASLRPQPTFFVSVATTHTFNNPDARSLNSVEALPLHPALYDPHAAKSEYEQIEARHTNRTQRLQALAERIDTDSHLAHRINDWHQRFPEGSIAALRARVQETALQHTAAAKTVDAHRTALERFPARRKEIDAEQPALHARKDILTTHQNRLTALHEQSTAIPAWQEQADTAARQADEHQRTATTAEELAEQCQGQASQHQRTADDAQRTVRTLNDERSRLPGNETVRESDPVPELSVALLRADYETARENYTRVSVGSDLLTDKRQAEEQAAKSGQRYTALANAVRTHARTLLNSAEGVDEATRAAARDRAADAQETAQRARERQAITEEMCRQELINASSLATLDTELPEEPQDIPGCLKAVAEAKTQRSTAVQQHAKLSAEHEDGERNLQTARRTADEFQFIVKGMAPDTAVPAPDEPAPPAYTEDAAAARDLISHLTQTKATALEQLRQTEEALQKAVADLTTHATAPRFKDLRIPVQSHIRVSGWQTVSAQAPEWTDQLKPRLRALNEELEQTARHRDLIIENLRGHVVKAIRILRQAQQVSKLPSSLGDWADEEFIRFHFKQAEAGLFTARLGDVIDEAAAGRTPEGRTVKRDGMSLLLSGVRAAVPRGFRVDMLKPDPVLRTERVRVGEIKDIFSGGQALTAAILLYCTMAALRANDRGRIRDSYAGVLFLDNPIGRANADYLLDLQRQVAESLGVQLIYTTGLSDDRTLKRFPLVLRLRNDADLRTGRKYLTVAERVQRQLDALDEPDGSGRIIATRLLRDPTHDKDAGETQGD